MQFQWPKGSPVVFLHGRLIMKTVDEIIGKVEQGRHARSYKIAKKLDIYHQTFSNNLKKVRYLGAT